MPLTKVAQAAAVVRAQIADGTLKPGSPAPSGTALARLTGLSEITCRRALAALVRSGTLVPGPSPTSRARVAGPAVGHGGVAAATRELSAALTSRRTAAGLTQPELAALTGYSKTTVGHAETGRTWQGPRFWESADSALDAGGELLRLYDARARAALPAALPAASEPGAARPEPDPVCVLIVWRDCSVTTVPGHLADLIVSELKASPPANPRRTEDGNAGL